MLFKTIARFFTLTCFGFLHLVGKSQFKPTELYLSIGYVEQLERVYDPTKTLKAPESIDIPYFAGITLEKERWSQIAFVEYRRVFYASPALKNYNNNGSSFGPNNLYSFGYGWRYRIFKGKSQFVFASISSSLSLNPRALKKNNTNLEDKLGYEYSKFSAKNAYDFEQYSKDKFLNPINFSGIFNLEYQIKVANKAFFSICPFASFGLLKIYSSSGYFIDKTTNFQGNYRLNYKGSYAGFLMKLGYRFIQYHELDYVRNKKK